VAPENAYSTSRLLKKVAICLAADERGSTLIESNWFVRVHRRLKIVSLDFSAVY
jgi:hypothetical protein